MKTKIIITYGPACSNLRTLKNVVSAGADVVRLNSKYVPVKDYDGICEKISLAGKAKVMIDIKDRKIIGKILDKRFDYLAISFAENPSEIVKIRKMFKRKIKIIAKVETRKGVSNVDDLIKVSDGTMIARGDLGHDIPFEKVPFVQKMITRKCNKKNIISITATEMMPSMITYVRPSRAEVTDVVNAILEGSEFLMLAEETAIGKHPVLAVKAMSKIIRETEKSKGF